MARTLRNAAYTFIDNYPLYGTTLGELPLLINNKQARANLVQNLSPSHSLSSDFWNTYDRMEKLQDRLALTGSTISRVEQFLQNRYIRHVVSQSKTTIDFRRIMDRGKILLVPLPRQHKQVKTLLGALLISQIIQAGFSRIDMPDHKRKPFFLYIDELGLFSSPAFADMIGALFAESRKFGIGFIGAHQWREQLDIETRKATLNAANLFAYAISGPNAQELALQYDHSPQPGEPQISYKRMLSPTPVNTVVLAKPPIHRT